LRGVETLEGRQLLATFAVTSLGDSGSGTLRQAIVQANRTPGPDTIEFDVAGTIRVGRASLPAITDPVKIDGTTAPGFAGSPVVTVDFRGTRGLNFARGADGSGLRSLSLVRAGDAGVTLNASFVTVEGNNIGVLADGVTAAGNRGDGVRINAGSHGNLIGHDDPVTGISYFGTQGVGIQPVSGWQGIRASGTSGQYLMTGTSGSQGLLYDGPISGVGGASYAVNVPGAVATSVYGADVLGNGDIRLVGTYRTGNDTVNGFLYEGAISDLADAANYRTVDYPGAQFTYVHSTMGGLAVGNFEEPSPTGAPLSGGRAFLYDVASNTFPAEIHFPGSISTTAYGIWYNGGTSYTICGGFTTVPGGPLGRDGLTMGHGLLVDYDSATGQFSHWTQIDYPTGPVGATLATHFEGISSAEKGVYTLNAGSIAAGPTVQGTSSVEFGSFVTVRRNPDGSFGPAAWVNLDYPYASGATTSNSVAGNQVVGIVITDSGNVAYQATVNVGARLSNVISGNQGNGIGVYGSSGNRIAMNHIGTDASGNVAVGNRGNGIRLTAGASFNRIGGQSTDGNDPTAGVFARPPQGNLISGNRANGVLIDGRAGRNLLSGNFIGTTASGNAALGNRRDGVAIDHADDNQLIGCTYQQSPFVFYNVISGNGGNGLRITDSGNTTVQANFFGVGADNATIVVNGGDGLLVSGDSANTQVGGVIPLGNVASGNGRNGIEVRDTAGGFISFNTFAGLYAFGTAAPNRQDGILITSTGGNNLVRTSIVSGNLGNGIELGGRAWGVQITDTGVGTDTALSAALPNAGSGIKFSGQANGNAVGGFQPSVEPTNTISANGRYGIEFAGSSHDNAVVHSHIGTTAAGVHPLGNALGGVYLGPGTRSNTIGGDSPAFQNTIAYNHGVGVTIDGSGGNAVLNDTIRDNAGDGVLVRSGRDNRVGGDTAGDAIVQNGGYGFRAQGVCDGTVVRGNRIAGNASGNADLSGSRGVVYVP
jgi:hypothetical protein